MTIWEVWKAFEEVHEEIFTSDEEKINRHWLSVCWLKRDDGLEAQIDRSYGIEYLQDRWVCAFGGVDPKQARKFLKYMMLFMVFGSKMADTEYLFDNGNLTEFFEEYPANKDRLKAFNICFGRLADWQRIKARMSKILR